MRQDKIFDARKTLAFWQDMASRLALTRIHGEKMNAGPVTADDVDNHLNRLRRESESLAEEGTPYVPVLIRLFVESDDHLKALLEAYGRNALRPPQKEAVTDLMKQMPGLWAAAAEIKMITDRDALFVPCDSNEVKAKPITSVETSKPKDAPHGPWTMSERPTGAWPDFHSLTIW